MMVEGRKPIVQSDIRRILVRSTNWVGDMVMTIPALEAVRTNFPTAHVTVLARPWVTSLIEGLPYVDQVIPFQKGRGKVADILETIKVAAIIRRLKFDLAILFQNAFEAALLVYLGGIKFRIGYNSDGRKWLLSHAIIRDDEIFKLHQVEYYLSILRAMGWGAGSKDPHLFVSDRDMEQARSLLLSYGIARGDFVLGLSPGAIFGPAKRWPPERFALLGDWAIARWGAKVILLGSESEREICNSVGRCMQAKPVNFCGMTRLREAMALIKQSSLFVTNDSGLMHVAAALDIPMIAIFGSTDPEITGPRSGKAKVVRHRTDCAPCFRTECPADYRCLQSIEADEVWHEMETLRRNFS